MSNFATLGLDPILVTAVAQAGFTDPTPVQAEAIPLALAGEDLMVSAQTGSGKTAAFMLPSLHRLAQLPPPDARKGSVRVLVLTPTRELAMQVSDATRLYGKTMRGLHAATIVGGMPYGAQLKALSRRVDVLVATPGRLLDHVQARRIDLSAVEVLVLDEADRMLDMGFVEDIETIVARTPATRQTLLFSATLDGTVARLAAGMMRNPKRIELTSQKEKHQNITQNLLYADDESHKAKLLDHLLRDVNVEQAIIFTSTKRGADDLAGRLSDQGFSAAALHGDMNQRQRNRTLTQMQRGQVQVLVATDVAARGIDVQGISHVVNYDLPMQAEDYVHRIGRTGRAGRSGLAFTLVTHSEQYKVRRIERYTGQPIPPQVVAGLEPQRTARPSAGPGRKPGGWQGKPGGAGKPGSKPGGFKPRSASPSSWTADGTRPASPSRPRKTAQASRW
jgi:superfamily II DNA/RNA helicase